ncbi:hypothetical protein F4808DRAFT_468545 [Astrocystis sublimbata]|nr:hypothetical protein F4808DRAFT_468545 [Astrocystis sublimbata]
MAERMGEAPRSPVQEPGPSDRNQDPTTLSGNGTAHEQASCIHDKHHSAVSIDEESSISETITEGSQSGDSRSPDSPRSNKALSSAIWMWKFELGLCLLSLGTLIVIITVLNAIDGLPLDESPLFISANTFLAFFASLARVTFTASVIEALSQWKWNALRRRKRPLKEFVLMDAATRGPFGALAMVWYFGVRNVAVIGAIVSITGLVSSPFTQQMLSYPSHLAPSNGTATVPITSYFEIDLTEFDAGEEFEHTALEAVMSFTAHPAKTVEVEAQCSAANCTFPRYKSLGICSHVADVSHLLSIVHTSSNMNTTTWTASLPNGMRLTTPGYLRAYNSQASNATISFANDTDRRETTLLNNFVIWANPSTGLNTSTNRSSKSSVFDFAAAEVAIGLCIITYETMVLQPDSLTSAVGTSYVPLRLQPLGAVHDDTDLNDRDKTQDRGRECVSLEQSSACGISSLVAGILDTRTTNTQDDNDSVKDNNVNKIIKMTLVDPGSDPTSTPETYTAHGASLVHLLGSVPFLLDASAEYYEDNYSNGNNEDTTFAHGQMQESSRERKSSSGNWFIQRALWRRGGQAFFEYNGKGNGNGTVMPIGNKISDAQIGNLEAYYAGVARMLTNSMRTSPTPNEHTDRITGTPWRQTTFIHVRWGWLSLLASQLVLSIVFLVVTIVSTWALQMPLVKSDVLGPMLATSEELGFLAVEDGKWKTSPNDPR